MKKTINKYFFKLINGEKIEINKEIFTKYTNYLNGDFYTVKTPKAQLIIPRTSIIFAYILEIEENV